MKYFLFAAGCGVFLAACGGSFPPIERLSELDVPLDSPANNLIAEPEAPRAEAPNGILQRLFSRAAPAVIPNATTAVTTGADLPFGEVASVCTLDNPPGEEIATAARNYTLIDSAPGSTAPRAFYVTGFADGCPRQFTAALAMFGAPSMHEQLRYGIPAQEYPYSTTDKAYEQVKSRVCGVGRKKPCGSKIDKLERSTVFISTYEQFSDNGRWADILLHDGDVMAAAIKAPE